MPDEPRRPRKSDLEYLRDVERLAKSVVDRAADEGWQTFRPQDDQLTPLQRSINEMARHLRYLHYEGDGCLDHD